MDRLTRIRVQNISSTWPTLFMNYIYGSCVLIFAPFQNLHRGHKRERTHFYHFGRLNLYLTRTTSGAHSPYTFLLFLGHTNPGNIIKYQSCTRIIVLSLFYPMALSDAYFSGHGRPLIAAISYIVFRGVTDEYMSLRVLPCFRPHRRNL